MPADSSAICRFTLRVNAGFSGGSVSIFPSAASFMTDLQNNNISYTTSCTPIAVQVPHSEFSYEVVDGSAVITGYKGSGGQIVIPQTISGFNVSAIGDGAFMNQTFITEVDVEADIASIGNHTFSGCNRITAIAFHGSSLKSIGNNAFYGCSGLRSVSLPAGVESLGHYAFYSCSLLTTVSLPDSLISIGDYAFHWCSSLSEISIRRNVQSIGKMAFAGCNSLKAITVSTNNSYYASTDGVLYNKQKTQLVCVPAGKTGEFTIPDTVHTIGENAFHGCVGLISVQIPASVRTIRNEAFFGASQLAGAYFYGEKPSSFGNSVFSNVAENFKIYYAVEVTYSWAPNGETTYYGYPIEPFDTTPPPTLHPDFEYFFSGSDATITGYRGAGGAVEIPPTVADGDIQYTVIAIGDNAFKNVSTITGTNIPDSIKSIGNFAFYGCTAMKSITIGNGVTTIGENAFFNSALQGISIPDGVITIGANAFAQCTQLTSASISSSVTQINGNIFAYCSSLTQISVQQGNLFYSSQNGALYNKNQSRLVACPGGSRGSVGTFGVTHGTAEIGDFAFAGCNGLNTISLPATLTKINPNSFRDCRSVRKFTVDIFNTHFSVWDDILYNYDKTTLIACPAGKLNTAAVFTATTAIAPYAFQNSSLSAVTISENVTAIGEYAFFAAFNITDITIPQSVTSIGNAAFMNCSKLGTASFYGHVPSFFGNDVFSGVASGFVIHYLEWNASSWSPGGETTFRGYPISAFEILKLKESSSYAIDLNRGRITGIKEGTTVEAFLANFTSTRTRVVKNNTVINHSDPVGTGYMIKLLDASGNEMHSLEVVLLGDATGDAFIDSRDIAIIQKHMLQRMNLNGCYFIAADTTGDGSIRTNDLIAVLKHILMIARIS